MQEYRALVIKDLDWIVDELRHLPKESKRFADVPDNPEYVKSYFEHMLLNGILFGAVCEDKSSFIIGCHNRPWYADRLEVHEMILWVPERFRGSRVAIQLIKEFTKLAMDFSPYCIHVGATLDISDNAKTLRLYEMCGYTIDGPYGAIMRL